eukprot:9316322-Pyramimonas_sp.AAC.1
MALKPQVEGIQAQMLELDNKLNGKHDECTQAVNTLKVDVSANAAVSDCGASSSWSQGSKRRRVECFACLRYPQLFRCMLSGRLPMLLTAGAQNSGRRWIGAFSEK